MRLGGAGRPAAVAFDIIGTVFTLEALRSPVTALGLPPSAVEHWYAVSGRDAIALAAAGDYQPFATVQEAALDAILFEQRLDPPRAARKAALDAMADLQPRGDAAAAFARLTQANVPVLALSNGSASATAKLLAQAGLDDKVRHIVSTDEVKLAKPRAEVYHRTARIAGVQPADLVLVAAHAWDVEGAKAAGSHAAYLSADRPFSPVMRRPDWEADTLLALVEALVA